MGRIRSASALVTAVMLGSYLAFAQTAAPNMSFFITSRGPGNGAALGGPAGADNHCSMLGTEATLTMGRALDLARHGLAGIVNVLPFSCMPGTVVAGMAPRLRQALHGLPWLDLLFDGQRETNIKTRLQAFMHQAWQWTGPSTVPGSEAPHREPAAALRPLP